MEFAYSEKVCCYQQRIEAFMAEHIYPNELRYYQEAERLGPWKVYPVIEELKPKARAVGLWNLFMPGSEHGAPARQKLHVKQEAQEQRGRISPYGESLQRR